MLAIDYDPIALGYVTSLARPGGNVTGIFLQQIELTTKRVQVVKDMFPDLRAATPSDLPIEQPTKFEFVLNLKTAKEIGLTTPGACTQRAFH